MVHTNTILIISATFCSFLVTIEGRSLILPAPRRVLWTPKHMGVEDWYRCHGYSCDVWNKTKDNLRIISDLMSELSDDSNMNITHSGDTFDGCIWLNKGQTDKIIEDLKHQKEDMNDKSTRKKRKVLDFDYYKPHITNWEFPIQWKFDGAHTEVEQEKIRSATSIWEEETCVRFEEVDTLAAVEKSHILVTKEDSGCHSFIGEQRYTEPPQQLNLQEPCLNEIGTAIHEFGHALGLWHEQQRADRDAYITIDYDNLKNYITQFYKERTVNYGVPYDYGSVMHYAAVAGSEDFSYTMRAMDERFQKTMGQRSELSFFDAKIINQVYCKDTCKDQPLPRGCEKGGYQDPNDCSRCKCPDGFTGLYCEELSQGFGEPCGGALLAGEQEKEITSPGYYDKGFYENHQKCYWTIWAPPGHKIEMRFADEFATYCGGWGECNHWVEIRDRDVALSGPRYCCTEGTPNDKFLSEGQQMMVLFRANQEIPWKEDRRGFKLLYKTVSENGETSTPETPFTPAFEWSCGFETEKTDKFDLGCDIMQDQTDQFDWTRQMGNTPSSATGPDNSYEGRYYIFIETSRPRVEHDKARIMLPAFNETGTMCVGFHYHMFGYYTNTLQLFRETNGTREKLWQKHREQGEDWQQAQIELTLNAGQRLGFMATRGAGWSGDIALDNIRVTSGDCTGLN